MNAPLVQNPPEGLRIITATERMAEPRGIKGCIFGRSGVGKTSLLWTLPAPTTLFVDLEAGDLAVEGWTGDTIRPRTWLECRDFAAFIGGPNPALRDDQPYSAAHYAAVCERFGDPRVAGPLRARSSSTASRSPAGSASSVAAGSRRRTSEQHRQTGHPRRLRPPRPRDDLLGSRSCSTRAARTSCWSGSSTRSSTTSTARSSRRRSTAARPAWSSPASVDEVLTLAAIKDEAGQLRRALVCQTLNPWGYPAKDRSGRLDMVEEPHLGRLFEKIRGPARPISERPSLPAPPRTPIAPTTTPAA